MFSDVMTQNRIPRQEIFVWEDLVFNLQAHDVVKSNRFVGAAEWQQMRLRDDEPNIAKRFGFAKGWD